MNTRKTHKVARPALRGGLNLPTLFANDVHFRQAVADELRSARVIHASPVSVHQSYGLLCEEVDEFFDEVKKKRAARDPEQMVKELVQIAAVAQRCATELIMPQYLSNLPAQGPQKDVPRGTSALLNETISRH